MLDFWEEYRKVLEDYILGHDIARIEEIQKSVSAFSTYLAISDPAYAYNASFLQVKFGLYEEFCRHAKDRYQVLWQIQAQNLVEDLRKGFSFEKITLTDGIWEIKSTRNKSASEFHLAKEFYRIKIKPQPKLEEIQYCLEWVKSYEQHCFVVTRKQAKEGFWVDPTVDTVYSEACNQLILKLKEARNPNGRETTEETTQR